MRAGRPTRRPRPHCGSAGARCARSAPEAGAAVARAALRLRLAKPRVGHCSPHYTRMTASPERRSRCPAPVMRRTCGRHIVCVFGDRAMRIRDGKSRTPRRSPHCWANWAIPARRILRRQDRAHRRASGRAPAGRASRDGGVQGFIGLHFIVQLALPGDFCRITYFCVSEAARGLGVGRELEETAAAGARARLRPHRGALPRAPRRRAPFLLPPGV